MREPLGDASDKDPPIGECPRAPTTITSTSISRATSGMPCAGRGPTQFAISRGVRLIVQRLALALVAGRRVASGDSRAYVN
jgi:hypothetical protein